jgi:SagB-type dehydrogenase family enzyme
VIKLTRGIGREFIEKSKYKYLEKSDQSKGIPQPPLEQEPAIGEKIIEIPDPKAANLGYVNFRDILENRRSVRTLWSCQGVKRTAGKTATYRTVPSAGARHPFETYILVNRVETLEPGLYKFFAIDHKLIEVNLEEDLADKIADACYNQNFVKTCAATFIFTAVTQRTYWRYGERGYRYMHLDAGHICQNLYLAAESIGGGACAIGAFYDDELNSILELDGVEQFTIYVTTIGKKF